jgi:D-methionine transport system substrate-binding protein
MKKRLFLSALAKPQNERERFMKSKFYNLIWLSLAIILSLSLAACSDKGATQKQNKVIKLGTLSTIEPLITALKDELVAKGYKVEVVMFDANNMPAIATKDGDIDGFVHNHLPWIETFNKENNSHLTMVKPYLCYYRTAVYSLKHKSLDQLPNGAQIAVPNDPSNLERSLLTLQDLKLLTLKPKTSKFYTPLDIKENPKQIKLIETEISTTARSINDADAVICPATRIKAAGIDPNSFLAEDNTTKDYPVGLTVDAKSVEEPWVKDAMKILASDEMRAKLEKIFSGTLVFYPK